ncbi:MAG: CHRD domain-containing protein, partial [Blastocatellia bacterium]
QVCYDITVKDIQTPTAAHIHAGAAGKAGGPKVTFKAAADGAWKGCVNADKALIKDLMDNPANYYVNVHNAEFPNGAVRGQLGK